MIRLVLGLAFAAISSAQVPWIFVNTLPGLCRVGESYFVTTAAAGIVGDDAERDFHVGDGRSVPHREQLLQKLPRYFDFPL